MKRFGRVVFQWMGAGIFGAAMLACGGSSDLLGDEGQPPAVGGFTPGPPGDGNGTGYGTGSGASYGGGGGTVEPPQPPVCDESLRRCAYLFTLAAHGGEQVVEIHGSFAADGWSTGQPMSLSNGVWSAEVDLPWATDVQYKFVVDGQWITDPANPNTVSDGYGGYNSLVDGITCEMWTCDTPVQGQYDWRDAVMYFVFVDRFFDGDPSNNSTVNNVDQPANYQGGDWAGVTKKIEAHYFNDLGVNTLWLSVPMDNTQGSGVGTDGHQYSGYHGYWPTNLDQTEPRFGTLAELQTLVDAAHEHGLKVIVDYAMNHVHVSSPVYQQHPEWFWPVQNGNQYCVCGQGCSWDGSEAKRCWFTDYLPDFNFAVPAAREYSVSNAINWITLTGIDGFRLDAVKHIEDSWIQELRQRVSDEIEPGTDQHFYMVGETYTGNRDTIKYYVNPSTMLDGQFDFPFRSAIISSVLTRSASMNELDSFVASNINFYGSGVMSTFIGNHDVPRIVHFAQDYPLWSDVWANGKDKAWYGQPGLPGEMSAFERLANAYTLLFTLPGVPLVYYGDEIGLPGAGDPDNRRFMQWSGYSGGQLFLKARLAKLAEIRAAHGSLRRGARTTLSVNNDTLAYRMKDGADQVIVVINRGDGSSSVGGIPSGSYLDELSGSTVTGPSVSVPARSAMVLHAK